MNNTFTYWKLGIILSPINVYFTSVVPILNYINIIVIFKNHLDINYKNTCALHKKKHVYLYKILGKYNYKLNKL